MWRCRCSSPTAGATPPAGAPTGLAASRPRTWSRSTTLLPVLAIAVEIRSNRRITKNLLNTYVGEHAGARILSGDIRRGSGITVSAAIWNCDLRGFTRISEQWPRDDVITWLNEYFDVMAAPVEKHGGEILKFVGDGMLAIFPLENPEACNEALQAAVEARRGMRELNDAPHRARLVRAGLRRGAARRRRHVRQYRHGDAPRLHRDRPGGQRDVPHADPDQGAAAAGAAVGAVRLLCGCSADFLTTLGQFPLRGVDEPIEVFGLSEER